MSQTGKIIGGVKGALQVRLQDGRVVTANGTLSHRFRDHTAFYFEAAPGRWEQTWRPPPAPESNRKASMPSSSRPLRASQAAFLTSGPGGLGFGGGFPGGMPQFPTGGGAPSSPGGGGKIGPACNLLPAGFLRDACKAGGEIFTPSGGGNGGGGGGGGSGFTPTGTSCPEGTIKVGSQCVALGDLFPGGAPGFTPAGGNAKQGAFGMPALTPVTRQRTHRSCPPGMVLGKDELCYPKAVLPRSSRFRKWRPGRKPLLTGGDMSAIRRAERVKGKVVNVAGDLGFKVSKKGGGRPKKR